MPQYTGFRESRRRGPLTDRRWLARIVYVAILLGIAGVVWWLRAMMLPFIIAFLLAFVFDPVVTWLNERRIPRWVGVIVVYAVVLSSVSLFIYFLVPIIDVESGRFAEKFNVVLKEAPKVYERIEAGVGRAVETAVGGAPPSGPAAVGPVLSRDEDWGFGPPVHKIPQVSPASVLHVAQLSLAASDEEVSAAGIAPPPTVSSLEVEGGSARLNAPRNAAQMTIEQLRPGVWGVRLGTSSIEVRQGGEGVFTVTPREQPFETSRFGDVKGQVIQAMRSGLQQFSSALLGGLFTFFQGLVAGVVNGVVAVVVVFLAGAFLLIDAPRLLRATRENVPRRYRTHLEELLQRLEQGLSGVVRGQLIICVVNGVLSFIGFYIFIPEYAVVLAILAAVMSLVPIFGTIISSVPAILLALTVSFGHGLGVLSWILGIHFIEAYILNPNIIGSQARIHPVLVVFVLIAGEFLYGMKGILLAVPATSIVQSVVQFAYARVKRYVL
jgi:predicted PurR-regulated permease PerM